MTISAASFQAQVAKRIGVAYFPFVFRDYDHVMLYAKSDVYGSFVEDYQKATSNRIVALTYAAERQVTSNKPILTPEDMKGLKIRVPDSAAYMAFPKALGANPTPIALGEVYLASRPAWWMPRRTPSTRSGRASSTRCRSTSRSPAMSSTR